MIGGAVAVRRVLDEVLGDQCSVGLLLDLGGEGAVEEVAVVDGVAVGLHVEGAWTPQRLNEIYRAILGGIRSGTVR